jgi:hypothetical protein
MILKVTSVIINGYVFESCEQGDYKNDIPVAMVTDGHFGDQYFKLPENAATGFQLSATAPPSCLEGAIAMTQKQRLETLEAVLAKQADRLATVEEKIAQLRGEKITEFAGCLDDSGSAVEAIRAEMFRVRKMFHGTKAGRELDAVISMFDTLHAQASGPNYKAMWEKLKIYSPEEDWPMRYRLIREIEAEQ